MKMKTVQELVKMLNISAIKLRKAARQGEVRGKKKKGRWLLNLDSVIVWIQNQYQVLLWGLVDIPRKEEFVQGGWW